jgi:protein-L-isoaspartate(D-aspartate) O-methyltransferase
MVEEQIAARGLRDPRVLEALRSVPRHEFVPPELLACAYEDRPLPIGAGQTISQPFIVALMSAALDLEGDETVLEVGTGSGYQTAVLAHLARRVYSLEIVPELLDTARAALDRTGCDRVELRAGDGYEGWPEAAPFDACIVTAAPDHIPQPLLDQLRVGGRLVLPVGPPESQDLLRIVRTENGFEPTTIAPVRFVPMTGAAERRPSQRRSMP